MNIRKIITVLNLLSTKVPDLSKLRVAKLLYFIDKEHLIKYGRFVTDDSYRKLDKGPIPSFILNMINDPNGMLVPDDIAYPRENISIAGTNNREISSKKEPDLDELSKSELEIIDDIVNRFGKLPIGGLIEVSHEERSWKESVMYESMSIEKMMDALSQEEKRQLLDHLAEDKKTERELATFF